MKKNNNFIFFFTIIFFLGIFTVFVEKEETHKNDSAIVKKIKELEVKEADGNEILWNHEKNRQFKIPAGCKNFRMKL